MLLGKISLSNNFELEGKMLSVKLNVFTNMQKKLNPYLKDDFLNLRNNLKYNVSEFVEWRSSKEDIVMKYAIKSYKIVVVYNYQNFWEFPDINKNDITIYDNDIIKEDFKK